MFRRAHAVIIIPVRSRFPPKVWYHTYETTHFTPQKDPTLTSNDCCGIRTLATFLANQFFRGGGGLKLIIFQTSAEFQIIIQINHQPDATIFQFIIQTFIQSSTCFGRFLAHHQEFNDCSSSLWFYLRNGYINRPTTNTARLLPRYEGKTRGCHCSH